jgi:hypothetical protein
MSKNWTILGLVVAMGLLFVLPVSAHQEDPSYWDIKNFSGYSSDRKINKAQTGSFPSDYYEGTSIYTSKDRVARAVDVLVVVNTDQYKVGHQKIVEMFTFAQNMWLLPKANVYFNLMEVKYVSFKKWDGQNAIASCLNEHFSKKVETVPEYIVMFFGDEASKEAGGYSFPYFLSAFGDKYENYCNEFKPIHGNPLTITVSVIDLGHKYAKCGYDASGNKKISDHSSGKECMGKAGVQCVSKNSYQMCDYAVDDFFAQGPLYFSDEMIVHELLHGYDEGTGHFQSEKCVAHMGGEQSFNDYIKTHSSGSIDDPNGYAIEWATMCPPVWDDFKDSAQNCN